MTTTSFAVTVAMAMLCAGCAAPERSRALGNPGTPASAIAQQVCSNCHGIDGNSVSPNFPRLAAQQEAYIAAQLTGFRGHNRFDPAGFEYMWGLSKHLSDGQINGLAAYFASQAAAPNTPGDPARAARGKDIYEHGVASREIPACASCHGPRALGGGIFPRLAGQHADYVVKQLLVFQGTDERPAGAMMKPVAHLLTRDDMQAVASYLQGIAAN